MRIHTVRSANCRWTCIKLAGVLMGAGVVVAAAIVATAGDSGRGGGVPVAGSGMAPPHTTYVQPVVTPVNLGETRWPATPSAEAGPAPEPPVGSAG